MSAPNRLVLSNFSTGLETYNKPFLLNNDAFPLLENCLIWRDRIIKKPGAQKLGVLRRDLTSKTLNQTTSNATTTTITDVLADTGVSNPTIRSTQSNGAIVPGSVAINVGAGVATWTDNGAGVLTAASGTAVAGTINYATGRVVLNFSVNPGGGVAIVFTTLSYYPHLPELGIEGYDVDASAHVPIDFPNNVFFDTIYAYQWSFTTLAFFDVSFYRTTGAPVVWSGTNYQQFYSSNYFGAMFVTNNKPGMQFVTISAISAAGTAQITTSVNHTLVTGDVVFISETTGTDSGNLNGHTFSVTVTGATTFTVPVSTAGGINNVGIVQYLTRISPTSTGDGIRWFDGFTAMHTTGFSNFAPPLDNLMTSSTTYLMGARVIIPFGNRLLAIGTFEATSANAASPTYYGNRVRYCQLLPAGPFYANSPNGLGIVANAWASNIQGFGGFIDLDSTDRIISSNITQDSLILGLESDQRKMVTTGIETDPFTIQIINPDFGNSGTFATVALDKGIMSVGEYGFLLTTSFNAQRFDEKMIDQIWEVGSANNGFDRISGIRDFPNEVLYFSYSSVDNLDIYPNRTVTYNYRDPSFAIWKENYTSYGVFKQQEGTPWEKITYVNWEDWDQPWESGLLSSTYPLVAAGNQQGYVMLKWASDSGNDPSLFIQSISGQQITSPNHGLEEGMFIGFQTPPAQSPSAGYQVVQIVSANAFVVDATANLSSLIPGVSEIVILDNFSIQTKQFANTWDIARKIRIGTQRYFLDKTTSGEFSIALLGSQSPIPINQPPLSIPLTQYPQIISNYVVRTRPDDSLGLYDSTSFQSQIWHRIPTSVLGDTVQIQMYLSNDQMANADIATEPWVLHAIVIDLYPSRVLA